jgi:hypothetical protein
VPVGRRNKPYGIVWRLRHRVKQTIQNTACIVDNLAFVNHTRTPVHRVTTHRPTRTVTVAELQAANTPSSSLPLHSTRVSIVFSARLYGSQV